MHDIITRYQATFAFLAPITMLVVSSCTASVYTSYKPAEIVIVSKENTFETAEASMQSEGLTVVEKNLEHGLIATKWEEQGKRQYNVQVLISPVGSVVKVGCRIQRSLDMEQCSSSTEVPVRLVKHAKAIARNIENAEENPTSFSSSFSVDE